MIMIFENYNYNMMNKPYNSNSINFITKTTNNELNPTTKILNNITYFRCSKVLPLFTFRKKVLHPQSKFKERQLNCSQ